MHDAVKKGPVHDAVKKGPVHARIGLAWILSLTLLSVPGRAQSLHGSVSGLVTDPSTAPVSGVRIRLVHQETNKTRSAVSDAQGEFVISSLPLGSYRLEAERAGYRKHVQNLVLQINQELRIEVALRLGSVKETVVVTGTPALLRTQSAALGAVIENRQIRGLPLDGRNFFELTLLLPGAVPAAPGSAGSVRGDFAIHINGAREDSNHFLLDGIYNGDPKLNGVGVNPPVDAIQEFEVLTSTYDASFGRNAGGQVSVVLKSGTNQFHGSVYEFLRNKSVDARNFFAPPNEDDPQYQRNQFGFSLGGPVRKDQTFFFSDYEGRRVREGITRGAVVPTLQERGGDFSRSRLPVPIDPFIGTPFADGKIPEARLHPVGRGIAALYPEPNRPGTPQNFVSSPALRDRDDHFDARLDHSLGESADLWFRYSFADRELFEPFSGPLFATVAGYGTDVPRRGQNLMLSGVHTVSPVLLHEVRAGFNRVAAGAFHENLGNSVNRSVGLPELSSKPRDFGLSLITVSGFSPLGDEFNNPQHSVSNTFQVLDQATYSHGRHLLKFGFGFRILQQNAFRDVQARGFLNFVGLTRNPLADLLLGFPTVTGGARLDNHQHLRTESYDLYVHDTYRIRANLTLTAGIRYEYTSPPVDAEDRANVYDPATQALVPVGSGGIPRSGYKADRNNWGPRLGIAWSPGNRSTVLRTGYGIYYDQASLAPGEGLYFNAPFFDFKLYFPLPPDFLFPDFPGFSLALDDPFPAVFPLPLPSSALAFQRDLRSPYVQHWNLSVQQELDDRRVLEVAYVGSKGTNLLTARDINQPRPSVLQPNPRPVRQFDDINLLESRSNSTYHAFQVRFQQRLHRELSLLTAYTWSKSLDDASSFFSSAGDPNFPQDSSNVRAERGRSNFDVRHRLSVSYSYDLPFGTRGAVLNRLGWLSTLLEGWQTHGILTFQSGRPFTVALLPENDNSNTGRSILGFGANDRPDRVGDGELDHPTPEGWFDTAAFSVPPRGRFGNSGRNILEGPGLQTINVSLLKNIILKEGWTFQFRAETFNLFNRANFDLPDIFKGSPTFGHILSAQSPRRIQVGLKLLF